MMADALNANNSGKTLTISYNAQVKIEATTEKSQCKLSVCQKQSKKRVNTHFTCATQCQKTPNVMTNIICDSMENWIHRH